jgi:hypothetical protein
LRNRDRAELIRHCPKAKGEEMRKEILRGFTMLMLVVAVALATAAGSVNAQTPNRVRANVPFEFVVGDKTLEAGEYTVQTAIAGGEALVIRGTENGMGAMRLSSQTDVAKVKTHARLVFRRYGEKYFLAQIWNGEKIGRELAKSRQERAIEHELASIPSRSELAQSTYETVEVVAVLH